MTKKIRILHVDDNLHDRQLVKDALENSQDIFEIIEADSREKFEKLLSENNFDLVLSDFNILGFDGLTVLQHVKKMYPNLPVIIVTGTGSEETAIQAMRMGAYDYVMKSVKHLQGLVPAINMVLEYKKAQEEKVRAEDALRASELKYKTLTEYAPVGIFGTDDKGETTYVNPRWCEIAGISAHEAIGNGWLDIVHPEDRPRLFDPWYEAVKEELISKAEYRFVHKDGSVTWVSGLAVPQKDHNGNLLGYIGTITDISELKMATLELLKSKEKAEESDRLKTAFLHNISHEIRTPLNAIVGFSSFLDQPDISDEDRRNYIDIIFQSNSQLLSIVNDILNISSIETGQVITRESETDLTSTMKYLYNQFLPEAQRKKLAFRCDTPADGTSQLITTDESKLIQILTNLLNNAFKFTNEGKVVLGYKNENGKILIFVEDSGIGIPENELERIFERFYQVDKRATREYGGTGLGLSISAGYAQLLGGKITVKSKEGQGSVFTLILPCDNEKCTEQKKIINYNRAKSSKSTKKILIAEDEISNYQFLALLIKSTSYEIVRAKNGKEAVDICKSDPDIEIVFMDLKMPVMDGFEAAREITRMKPEMIIIAQTAYAYEADRQKAAECGCSDYIAKPFNKEQILALIEKYGNH